MLRKLIVPFSLTLLAVGCGSGGTSTDTSVTIVSPKDQTNLTMSDDVANDLDGLQIDVKATTSGYASGAIAALFLDGTAVASASPAADGSVVFSKVTLTSGYHAIKVGVANADSSKVAEATVNVTVDDSVVSPSVSIISPADHAVFNHQSDTSSDTDLQTSVQVKSAGVSTGTIRICAQSSGPITGTTCSHAPGVMVGTASLDVSNTTTVAVTLPEGAISLVAEYESGDGTISTSSSAITVTVDLTGPLMVFEEPADGATIKSQSVTARLSITGAEIGQPVTITSSLITTGPAGTGAVDSNQQASIALNLPLGQQTLTASVADQAGNPATASILVTVDIEGCDVALTDPSTASYTFYTGTTGIQISGSSPKTGTYTIRGQTTLCASGKATFTKTVGSAVAAPVLVDIDSSGNFSYDAVMQDGEFNATFNVQVNKDGHATNDGVNLSYLADFSVPTISDAQPAFGNMYIVNSANPHSQEAGYVIDADSGEIGGQVDLSLVVAGAGSISGSGQGSVVVSAAGNELIRQAYTDNGQQTIGQRITLDEGFSGTVTLTLTDAVGNQTVQTWNAKVATQSLPTPTITLPTAHAINVNYDLGGDRQTYASIQSVVSFSSAVSAGNLIYLCSTSQVGSAPACAKSGYYELPNTRLTASGTSQVYPSVRLPQGDQTVVAEMLNAVGDTVDSATVHLPVDTIPPQVLSVIAANDSNHDSVISAAELPVGQSATITATFSGVEDGQMAVLKDGATTITTASVSSNAVSFTVPNPSDGAHAYKVLVTDAVGNPNESTTVSPVITNPNDALSLTVARVAPSIALVAPSFGVCNLANDKEPASPSTCEVDVTVSVGSSAVRVEFSGSPGAAVASVNPSTVTNLTGGSATATFSLNQSAVPVTLTATVFDQIGNSRSTSVIMSLVDTQAPSLTITNPTVGETLSSQTIIFAVQTDAEVGQEVVVSSSANNSQVGKGTVVAGSPNIASFSVSLPYGAQTLRATVTDAAGNPSDEASVAVNMLLSGCPVNYTNPTTGTPVFNATNAPGGVVTIQGVTPVSSCWGRDITFSVVVDGGIAQTVGTVTTNPANGQFEFQHTFGDGTSTVFSALVSFPNSQPAGFTAYTDITAPEVKINSPSGDSNGNIYLVAKTGNINVKNNVQGYVADADDGIAGGQLDLNLDITGGAASVAGNGSGKLEILQGTTVKATQTISDNGTVHVDALRVNIDQAYAGPASVRVTDAAGNVNTQTAQMLVDVVSPEAPEFVIDASDTRIVHQRHADLALVVKTPSDDGITGQTLTWDVGYSTSTRLDTTAFDTAAFENGTLTTPISMGSVGSTGSLSSAQLTNLPPLNTFYLGARIRDGVGNTSNLVTTTLQPWAELDIAYPGTSSSAAYFGTNISKGADIDGDGVPDFAVSAHKENTNLGAIYVYNGGTMPPSLNATLKGATASGQFGYSMAMRDFTGDGHADLVAYEKGNIDFFAATSTSGHWTFNATPDFKFHSSGALTTVVAIPDINGDGAAEIAMAETSYSIPSGAASVGRVFVFFGRSDWSSLVSGGLVDVISHADLTITGTEAGGKLGTGGGFAGVQDPTVAGKGALSISASYAKKVYLFTSAVLNAGGSILATNGIGPFYINPTGPEPDKDTFGDSCVVVDVNGDSLPDVVIGDAFARAIYAFPQGLGGTFSIDPNVTPFAAGSSFFGYRLAVDDLNADSKSDIVVGGNNTAPGIVSLLWSGSSGIQLPTGTIVRNSTNANSFGNAISVVDVNNDGFIDLIIGSPMGGSDLNGKITIRY